MDKIVAPENWETYPFIPREEVRLELHMGYWDGPLSGICRYGKERCFFLHATEYGYPFDARRPMALYILSADIMRVIDEQHKLFQDLVGHHTDYDENEELHRADLKHQSEWHKFYDLPHEEVDWAGAQIIGWFYMWPDATWPDWADDDEDDEETLATQ